MLEMKDAGKEVLLVLVSHVCAIAFYCQRCGKIHMQDVPVFHGRKSLVLRCGSCGHEQAVLSMQPRQGLVLEATCGACGNRNRMIFPFSHLRRLEFEKLFCERDRFELGYIGSWRRIAEFLDFNAAEYDALHPEDLDDFMGKQQVLLEALNRVHDLVAGRSVFCPCGCHDFTGDVLENTVYLECMRCGRMAAIPAATAEDLSRIRLGMPLDFLAMRCMQK